MKKVNLLIDDFYPGVSKNSREWRAIEHLLLFQPRLKIALFTVADMWEDLQNNVAFAVSSRLYRDSFLLTKHPEWCEWAISLDPERIEIGCHGLYHWDLKHDNCQEFRRIDKTAIEKKILIMKNVFKQAGLWKDGMGFRPPGHRYNPDLLGVLKDHGFGYISTHDDQDMDYDPTYGFPAVQTREDKTRWFVNAHFGPKATDNIAARAPLIEDWLELFEKQGEELQFRTLKEANDEP